jgi:DNA repair protein RadA/Sms
VWFGEVSLAGEIRRVAHAPLRQREAAKLGFDSAFGPQGALSEGADIKHTGLAILPNLVDRIMGQA